MKKVSLLLGLLLVVPATAQSTLPQRRNVRRMSPFGEIQIRSQNMRKPKPLSSEMAFRIEQR